MEKIKRHPAKDLSNHLSARWKKMLFKEMQDSIIEDYHYLYNNNNIRIIKRVRDAHGSGSDMLE